MNEQYRLLGNTSLNVSPIVFGGNVFGWTLNPSDSFAILDQFIDLGFNSIDTANNYSHWVEGNQGGESEIILGSWFKSRKNRSQVILMTKVGGRFGYHNKPNTQREYILQEVENSLRRLQTDYIDLYQTHYDDLVTAPEDTLRAYQQLISAGKVRYIGVSNISPERLIESMEIARELDLPTYASLQPEYNLYDRKKYEQEYRSLVERYQMGVIPYYALASGFLSGKYQSEHDFASSARGEGIQKRYWNSRGKQIVTALTQTAEELNCSAASLALAWLMAQPDITAPIASATKSGHLEDFLSACNLNLENTTLEKLNQASAY